MKIVSVFVRRFDERLFWRFYQKGNREGRALLSPLYKFLYMRMASKNAGYIGRETILEGPLKLPHGFNGIHISRKARIGKNCTIFQNTTIGQSKDSAPVIGDNCVIGASVLIIGDVKIGNNAKIGAGAIVVEDVPDGATVVGPKAIIINN